MPGIVVVGLQWGDEGKGKVVDLLSQNAKHVVRSQGGNNAGHTVVVDQTEYQFHLIPSGVVYPHTICYIAAGTVIDPKVLIDEMAKLEAAKVDFRDRIKISPLAHVILDYHIQIDKLQEKFRGKFSLGTTGRGIGPCYADKVNRVGIRICDLVDEKILRERLKEIFSYKMLEYPSLELGEEKFEELFAKFSLLGKKLKPFLTQVEVDLERALQNNESVLLEGAHGFGLDTTFGSYPYVTSSSTYSSGIIAGAGIGPTKVSHVIGVLKAYTTRVGSGALPTQLPSEEEHLFLNHAEAREIGTTTGRKRRMGWLDCVAAKYSIAVNGVNSLALMKLDILDSLPYIKVCVGYRSGGKVMDSYPYQKEEWEAVEPVYETLSGWKESTKECKSLEDMPTNAKKYLRWIESYFKLPIHLISLGPQRSSTIIVKNIFSS
ncbi:MAG: adenylosuccinate synthase [Chlamydiae bacterium]|jgi:adenylosuccinate synthase|nr:adenylosuccinate synthase [Chlamydiota bacterium]